VIGAFGGEFMFFDPKRESGMTKTKDKGMTKSQMPNSGGRQVTELRCQRAAGEVQISPYSLRLGGSQFPSLAGQPPAFAQL
jgi:hypothetical protein